VEQAITSLGAGWQLLILTNAPTPCRWWQMCRPEQLKDIAATAVAPKAQHVFALLVAENHEPQNALVHFTAGAKLDSIVQKLLNRLGKHGSGA